MRNLRAAVRFFLFTTATLGIYSFWFAARVFVRDKVRWRQTIFAAWTMSFVRISKMRIKVSGTPPKPPFFLVTNHLSYADIGAIRGRKRHICSKKDIENWPVAGRICRDMGTIFIDRENRRDIPRAGELITQRLDAGEGVIVFPEGVSTKGDKIYPFNSSFFEFAARSRVPVSYASLRYRTPDGEMPAHLAVCWWQDIGFFPHIWRLFKLTKYEVLLNFGESPIVGTDRKALAAELRKRIEDKFEPVE